MQTLVTSLPLNAANQAQYKAGLSISVEDFLRLENCSRMAFGVAVAQSLETLGEKSPVLEHLDSLAKDYGTLLPVGAEGFAIAVELAVAEYANVLAIDSARADRAYDTLVSLIGAQSADNLFRRVYSTAARWTQDGVDDLRDDLRAGVVRFAPAMPSAVNSKR